MDGERTQGRSPFCFGEAGRVRAHPFSERRASGFSLAELVGVLVIAAVLFAVAAPKFSSVGFSESGFANETAAALRYAQRSALAMQRTVCVEFLSATSLQLRYRNAYGTGACDTDLPPPGGGTPPYTVSATGSASFSGYSNFSFDRIGKPSFASTLTITLNDGRTVVVEKESGFVH